MTRTQATSKGMKIYSGTGTISAGTKAEVVSNNHVTANSKVLVEMTADMTPAVRQWVSGKSGTPTNWYDVNWTKRKKITIDNTKVDATLSDFPVLISLATDAELAANARANGYDILFTSSDGLTKLKHEIQRYTTATGELIAWVKVPSVSSSADTDIYMYYGYATATDQSDAVNVWDANYKMVQHMKDTTTSTITDSTINANNGTKLAANEPIETTSGQIGKAQDFDGSNDYMDMGNAASLNINDELTISTWIKPDVVNVWQRIISQGKYTTEWIFGITDTGKIDFTVKDVVNPYYSIYGDTTLSTASYQHIVVTYSKSNGEVLLYLNGVLDRTPYSVSNNIADSGISVQIGRSNSTYYFNGVIDEVRISSSARSADWIKAGYNNQNSPGTFYTLGSQETPSPEFILNTDANVTNNTTFDYAVIN